ncbi:hypothetical protein [Nodularia spumigena]|jgi:hypothetical protein|uniref:hypothetical protein n=1 Tax=Nodularia spumigena TaxID=70799 RepID=UPI00232AC9B8|nr:hypothetical protein [Nodularia spumigena]MDB9498562.1 hypothetical protein [Nodularia spumigena CS-336/02]
MYNINFNQLASELLPAMLRSKQVVVAFVRVCISPIKALHQNFLMYRQEAIYKASFTGQIIYLEKRLNDRFDAILRRIYIENTADQSFVYLFNSSENEPRILYNNYDSTVSYVADDYVSTATGVYKCINSTTGVNPETSADWVIVAGNTYLLNQSEYALVYDFIVMVPAAINFSIPEMQAIVTYYKLAGKRFTIQTF